MLEQQFPSNYYAWHHLAETRGAAIVAVPPYHWTDSGSLDLVAIGTACRAQGAALVVDATQYIGAAPFDVAAVRPDFMVCSAYKWLLCPYMLAFFYAAPHRQNGNPIEFHDGARQSDPGHTENAPDYAMAFRDNAHRYDMGERNNYITLPMAVAALKQLHEWTPQAIAETLAAVTDRVAAAATERGYAVPPAAHRVAHFIGLRGGEPPPRDLDARCSEDGVYFNLRGAAIRVSPHLFIDETDIDRFLSALDRHYRP